LGKNDAVISYALGNQLRGLCDFYDILHKSWQSDDSDQRFGRKSPAPYMQLNIDVHFYELIQPRSGGEDERGEVKKGLFASLVILMG
jgi:hypothetical protein